MIRACIFDLDGVIVDTTHYHFFSWKRLANTMGFDLSEEQNEALKGVSRMDSLEIILEIGGLIKTEEEKQSLAAIKNVWYQESIAKMKPDEILPGALQFLTELKENGYKVAVASSSKNARKVLRVTGIFDLFDAIVDGTDIRKSKPDPEVFLLAAEKLGVSPHESVVFEDAFSGIEAAHRGGFIAIGIGKTKHLSNTDKVLESFIDFNLNDLTVLLNEVPNTIEK